MSKAKERKLTDSESRGLEQLRAVGIGRAARDRWAVVHTGRCLVGGDAEMVLDELKGGGFRVLLQRTPAAKALLKTQAVRAGSSVAKAERRLKIAVASRDKAAANRDRAKRPDQVAGWDRLVVQHSAAVQKAKEALSEQRARAGEASAAVRVPLEEWEWVFDSNGAKVSDGPYVRPESPFKAARAEKRKERLAARQAEHDERARRAKVRAALAAERAAGPATELGRAKSAAKAAGKKKGAKSAAKG